jgi:hypothetical protein
MPVDSVKCDEGPKLAQLEITFGPAGHDLGFACRHAIEMAFMRHFLSQPTKQEIKVARLLMESS